MATKKRILTRAVVLLASGLCGIFWIYLAHRFGYLPLSDFLFSVVRDVGIVLGSYLTASLFINLTAGKVVKIFVETDVEHRILLRKAYTWLVYILATNIVLVKLGLSFQQLALYLSLLATGFAFAIRDIIFSYIAWFILLVKQPFRIGDCIKIGDDEGRVVHIGTFYVLLDENPADGSFVRVPNKVFLERPIRNFGHETARFSVALPVGRMPSGKELKALEKSVQKFAGRDAAFVFNGDTDRLFVRIEYNCLYENRRLIRDRIVRLVAGKFMKGKV